MRVPLIVALILPLPVAAQPAAPQAVAATAPALTVTFEGIATPTGRIMLSLFNDERAFDGGGAPLAGAIATVNGATVNGATATASFAGLPPGRYAIKAFHDMDGDGKMKSNPFGMPLEPYAFSNNAQPQGGPARWAAASFDLPAGGAAIRIAIQ